MNTTTTASGVTVAATQDARATVITTQVSPDELMARKASQLSGLMELITGDGHAVLQSFDQDTRDALLWLAADHALEVKLLAELAAQLHLQKGGQA